MAFGSFFRDIEILTNGIRCVHSLDDGHVIRSCACIHYNEIIVGFQGTAYKIHSGFAGIHSFPPYFCLGTVAPRAQLLIA